jgi:hypothetical protein
MYGRFTIWPANTTLMFEHIMPGDQGGTNVTGIYNFGSRANDTWKWGAKASNASVLVNGSINWIEDTLMSEYGYINYTWAISATDDSSQTTMSSNRTLQITSSDITPPDPVFVSPTQANQTEENVTWFYVNVSTGESLSTCYLDIYPEVVVNYDTPVSDNWEVTYNLNLSYYSSDNEHSDIGRVCINSTNSSHPCDGSGFDEYNITYERAFDYYDLSSITANVTNATYYFGKDNEQGLSYPQSDFTVSIYYNSSFNHGYTYCDTNQSTRAECWARGDDATLIQANIDYYSIPEGGFSTTELDLTDIINDEITANGGDGEIVFIWVTNKETVVDRHESYTSMEWDITHQGKNSINHTINAYENISMAVTGQYCYYNATLQLLPPNATEFYYMVYANDTSGNENVTEARAWIYALQEAVSDTQAPEITIENPTNTTDETTNAVSLDISYNETVSWAYWMLDSGYNMTNTQLAENVSLDNALYYGHWTNGTDHWFVYDNSKHYINHTDSSGNHLDGCKINYAVTNGRGLDSNSSGVPNTFLITDIGLDRVIAVTWVANGTCSDAGYWDNDGSGYGDTWGVATNDTGAINYIVVTDTTEEQVMFLYNSTGISRVMENFQNISASSLGCDQVWGIDFVRPHRFFRCKVHARHQLHGLLDSGRLRELIPHGLFTSGTILHGQYVSELHRGHPPP